LNRKQEKLTRLDSSGDAKLNNNTLTLTVKVPETFQEVKKNERKIEEQKNKKKPLNESVRMHSYPLNVILLCSGEQPVCRGKLVYFEDF
jgi:hypothetical protein